jgi:hypothetical protein
LLLLYQGDIVPRNFAPHPILHKSRPYSQLVAKRCCRLACSLLETLFITQDVFVRNICSWWKAFVNRGSTVFAFVSTSSTSRMFCLSTASKCDVHQKDRLTVIPTAVSAETLALRIQKPATSGSVYSHFHLHNLIFPR